jgi:hypothetical protein
MAALTLFQRMVQLELALTEMGPLKSLACVRDVRLWQQQMFEARQTLQRACGEHASGCAFDRADAVAAVLPMVAILHKSSEMPADVVVASIETLSHFPSVVQGECAPVHRATVVPRL